MKFNLLRDEQKGLALQHIIRIIHEKTGHSFSNYKLGVIYQRILKQMYEHNIDTLKKYIHFLSFHSKEINYLFKGLLIGVTKFFRNAEAFDSLKSIFTDMIQKKSKKCTLRVWCAGCSTGEEVYSIAIIIYEAMEELNHFCKVEIIGTDINQEALTKANLGFYLKNKCLDINLERLSKFFDKQNHYYKIKKFIKKMVFFNKINVISDSPIQELDVVCCRNLLIYLNTDTQKKILQRFHDNLNTNGILFLGHAESIIGSYYLFKPRILKWKIFEHRAI